MNSYWPKLIFAIVTPLALAGCGSKSNINNEQQSQTKPDDSIVKNIESAVVSDHQAEFRFPVTDQIRWNWYQTETPENSCEYSWMVEIKVLDNNYQFGYSIFNPGDMSERSGGLQQLLNAGQIDLWLIEEQGGGKVVGNSALVGPAIQARAEKGCVVVEVTDQSMIDHFFGEKPESVVLSSSIWGSKPTTSQVDINYK